MQNPLEIPEFRLFIGARFFVTLALQSIRLVLSWQVLALTRSPLALGLMGIAEFGPHFFMSFFGGYFADRYSRRAILLWCIAAIFLCSLILLGLKLTFFSDKYPQLAVGALYSVMGIIGIVRSFYAPAALSFMAHIVPRALYPKSSAWNSSAWQIAAMSGPALGGLIYAYGGAVSAHAFNCALLFFAFLLMLSTRTKAVPRQARELEKVWISIGRGLRFVYKRKVLFGALFLDLFAVLFGGAVALLPIFADTILNVGPSGLGLLRAAPAVGALLISLILTRWPPLKHTGRNLLWAVSAFGVCMILFAFSRNFYLSLLLLFLSGAFDCVSVVIRATMIQLLTPDNMRGKVAAINSIFISSSNELGAFESGVTAEWLGTINSVWIGGLLTQIVVAATVVFFPALRSLELHQLTAKLEKKEN